MRDRFIAQITDEVLILVLEVLLPEGISGRFGGDVVETFIVTGPGDFDWAGFLIRNAEAFPNLPVPNRHHGNLDAIVVLVGRKIVGDELPVRRERNVRYWSVRTIGGFKQSLRPSPIWLFTADGPRRCPLSRSSRRCSEVEISSIRLSQVPFNPGCFV